MSGTSSQDARTSGPSQNGVSQPVESCLSTMNCELTQAIQEIVECVMSDVETARCKRVLAQRMDIDFVQLIRKRPLPLGESVLIRKKNIIQQEQKKLRWKRSVRNDTLPDEWLALYGLKATPENKLPPDSLFPKRVTANMLNFVVPPVTFPTATPAPPSQPLANPIESKNASAGPINEDKKNAPKRFRSLRPKQAGVIYFSRKTKATARQRPPKPRVRPILDLRRIKISPSLQIAGFQADHDAAVAEDPSILAMRYDISHFYMNVNDELVPIQGPYIYVEGKIAQEIEEPAKQGYDPGWQNPSPISGSSTGGKWWLLLLCVAILWCMWPSGETNKKRWKEANEVPEDLHTRLKENRNSEFEFIQKLAYEMAMRSDFDLVMMG
ncbi:uncharacterized protein BDW43DRAFT_268734 [Aspergillus alliaceus]|uniref:uncharacterized protein n=1 Tax=Petromyces alliaceus TaxID=209559 RepID=UPI0012A4805E|nr:uncharacterized protein BDW43DRAFT_268734 [Aspergillus alliaceus]KAB8235973.1 hypothetical protein BDW43DRAFT_268734 [Aspergillus alliaceus]